MKKIITIVGPTGSGKSDLAIFLAQKLFGYIISADSVGVYKNYDIGSAKPSKEELSLVKHYLVDVCSEYEDFDVSMFQKMSRSIIESNKEICFLCGGTGLYVQSVLYDYRFLSCKRDKSFEQKYINFSNEKLYSLLKEKNETLASKTHFNNRNRVLRYLEFIESNSYSEDMNLSNNKIYDSFVIYLDLDKDLLDKRLRLRVNKMMSLGLLDEVKDLYDRKVLKNCISYSEFIPYFEGKITLDEALEDIVKNCKKLAKKQKTWFKNKMNINMYNVSDLNYNNILKDVCSYLFPKKIYLCGFSYTGKTTLGKMLSNIFQYDFFDTDNLLEEKFGMSIKEFFEKFGEEKFRNEENKIIEELKSKDGIISLGGGSLINLDNIRNLNGFVIELKTNKEVIQKRINSTNRPLFSLEKFEDLYNTRKPGYKRASDMIFVNDYNNEEEALKQLVISLYENTCN